MSTPKEIAEDYIRDNVCKCPPRWPLRRSPGECLICSKPKVLAADYLRLLAVVEGDREFCRCHAEDNPNNPGVHAWNLYAQGVATKKWSRRPAGPWEEEKEGEK